MITATRATGGRRWLSDLLVPSGTLRHHMHVFYRPEYVMAATEFDTTRKAAWVADSLTSRPIPGVELVVPEPLTEEDVARVHDPAYVRAVVTGSPWELAASNGFDWDPQLMPMVLASNGGVVAACLEVLEHGGIAGSLSSGLHHARYDRGAGFCTFNGLALAAQAAKRAGAGRILIVDLDAHCGGGTWRLLGEDPAIDQMDIAVDAFDHYSPQGRWTLDLVRDVSDYLPTIAARLDAVDARGTAYDLVLYNAGMDPYEGSRVGGLHGVDAVILGERESTVFDWIRGHGWPVAWVLAGGYANDEAGRADLVDLHRATMRAAVGRRSSGVSAAADPPTGPASTG